jgi:hypothetical protein
MRFAGVVLSAVLGIWANAASAEVLAVCGEPQKEPAGLSAMLGITPASSGNAGQLALVRDDSGFDIVLNWGDTSQHSLRKDGAEILGDQLGGNFFHLLVARPEGLSLEHFVFALEDLGPGELLWSAADGIDSSEPEAVTLASACVKPK